MKFIFILLTLISTFLAGFFCARKSTILEFTELIGKGEKYDQISSDLAALQIDYQNQLDVISMYEKELSHKAETHVVSISKSNFGIKGKVFLDDDNQEKTYEVYLPDGDKKGPPIGYISISNRTITSKVYDHDIEIIQGTERDPKTGRFKVLAKGFFVLKENAKSQWKDKKFPLQITGGSVTVDPTFGIISKNKFYFKPRITAGIEFVKDDVLALGNVYPVSYGPNPDFSTFRLFGLGISGNKNSSIHFVLSPISLNLNKIIKPLHNTYIGPAIDFNSDGNMNFGASLQLGL